MGQYQQSPGGYIAHGMIMSVWGVDHPRDHPGRYLYYVGTFWLYLQNVTLVCVLCAYN
jgi:hypothetical protein